MGKDLKEKEPGVGIRQRFDRFYVCKFTSYMDNGNRNYTVNYKGADSGWHIHSTRTSMVI